MELDRTVLHKSCMVEEAQELQNIRLTTASISALDITLYEAYSSFCPSATEYEHRKHLVHCINEMVKDSNIGGIHGSPFVEAFGSFIMDMFSANSDLDMSMNFSSDVKSPFPRDKQATILRNFVKILSSRGEGVFHHVKPILKARVPIVKFFDRISGIECDVSVENKDAIIKSFAIHVISSIDERFRILSCLMKMWAKAHNINSSKDHTLNSLSIILLVAFHLQIQSKRRSNLDPERLKKLVFIKYNKSLHERFEKRRAQNNSGDFDPILVEDLNYSSEWMTGKTGAFNEFVYGEERLTWAETRDPPILPPFSAILKGGTERTILRDIVGEFKDFGRANLETLAELFTSFLCKLSSAQTLWEKGLCASTFEGSWIVKLWDHEVGIMSVEDFSDRSQNCARAVKRNEFKTIYQCIHKTIKNVSLFMTGQIDASFLKTLLFGPIPLHTSRKLREHVEHKKIGSGKRKGLLKATSGTESVSGISPKRVRITEQMIGESSSNLSPEGPSKKTLKRAQTRARKRELIAKQKAAGKQTNNSVVTNKRKRSDQTQASNKSSNNISCLLSTQTARRPARQAQGSSDHARSYFTDVLVQNQHACSHFRPRANNIGFSQQNQFVPVRSINYSSQYHSQAPLVPTSLNCDPIHLQQSLNVLSGQSCYTSGAQQRYRLSGYDNVAGSEQPQISYIPSLQSHIPRFRQQIPRLPSRQRYMEELQRPQTNHPFGHGYIPFPGGIRPSPRNQQSQADYYRPFHSNGFDLMFHIPRDRWMQ